MLAIEKYLPEDYAVCLNHLYHIKRLRKNVEISTELCNFVPYIVTEIIYDDGLEIKRRYEVEGVDKNGSLLPRIKVDDKDFNSLEWIRQKWGLICNIVPDNFAVKRIRYALQATADGAEKKHIYLTTGWKKVDGKWDYLMPGNNKYTVELPGRLSGYGFNRDMNPENLRYLPKLLNSVAPSRIMYPLVAYAFLSVLNTFLKEAGHEPKNIFVLMGKTGSKKSTLAALILSLFGSFSVTDLPMSFRDTQNSMELFMYYLMDALTVVDDFHPTKAQDKAKQEAQFQSMCRLIGNRSARGRLNSNCEYRTDRVPKCNAIVTAEFLPDIGESGTARLFPLRLNSNDINNDELTEFQNLAAKGVLSSTMFQFIEYLKETKLNNGTNFIDELRLATKISRQHIMANAEAKGIVLRDRLIDDLASLLTVSIYLTEFLFNKGVIPEEEQTQMNKRFIDTLIEDGAEQQKITITDQPTHIFISKLQTLIDAKQAVIVNKNSDEVFYPDSKFVGYYDDNNYYFDKSLSHKVVKSLCREQNEGFEISEKGLCDALKNENISIFDKGSTLKKIRVKDKIIRCICIPMDVMRSIADGEEPPKEDLPFGPGTIEEAEQLCL